MSQPLPAVQRHNTLHRRWAVPRMADNCTGLRCSAASRKLNQDLSLCEPKPNIVTQQCVVYLFKCDLCDAGYVGYTKGHLHTRVEGHRQKASSICKHYYKDNTAVPNNFLACFIVIKKCMNKFDCLVNEMLCIQELKPTLNVQSDSLRAKVFK